MRKTGRWVVALTEKERKAVSEAMDFMDLNAGLTPEGKRAQRKVDHDCVEEFK